MKHMIPASNTDAASAASFQSTPTAPAMPTAPAGNPTQAPPYVTPGNVRDTAPASSPALGTGVVTYPAPESDSMFATRALATAKELDRDESNYRIDLSEHAEAKPSVDSDLFASCAPPIKTVQIEVDNYVFNTFRSGLKVLVDHWDVAKAAGTYHHTVVDFAGDKNTACFPKSDFAKYYYYPASTLTDPYLFSDFAISFLALSKFGPKNAKLLQKRIYQNLLSPEQLTRDKGIVHANILWGFLSAGTPPDIWTHQMKHKNPKIGKYLPSPFSILDFYSAIIPISVAHESALKEGTFAGLVASILLLDGGYFHGGDLLDRANYSLMRCMDILPDERDRVSIPQLYKFLRDPSNLIHKLNEICPFDIHNWIRREPIFPNPIEPKIDVLSAYDFIRADHDPDYRFCGEAMNLDY